jgi:putative tricarboxylic transport membrane protein
VPLSKPEIALSAGVLAIGVGAAAITLGLPAEGGYSRIGPNFMPGLVSAGLIALGAWLLYEALSGGWRNREPQPEVFHRSAFLWVSAGLFVFVARGFGSHRFLRDLAIGVAMSLGVYLFFSQVLNVNLPAGWMLFKP